MRVERIVVGSEEHRAAIELRERVLRLPLGLKGLSSEELAAEPKAVHLACFLDKMLVGTLLLIEERKGVFRMRQVAVLPELQGRGIGTELIGCAEAYCRAYGIEALIAHARATVVPFYEKLGYHAQGDAFIEVTLEHRLVQKQLGR